MTPDDFEPLDTAPSLSAIPDLPDRYERKKDYRRDVADWKKRMLRVQQTYFSQGQRVVLVFEGVDAAGKGGAIRRLTALLDPRGFTVHSIGPPTALEHGRHYLYRFFHRLPIPGALAIFDRSWYGRLLVERVEGFATPPEWQRAYREIREFERWLTDDGVRVVKIFLHIDKDEQARRFLLRLKTPEKRWKLTEEDIRNRQQWDDYEAATNEMFKRTHTDNAPWHLISGRRKWTARVEVLRTVVCALERGVNLEPVQTDPAALLAAQKELGLDSTEDL
ncbi:polyphosphate kinase 2 family protein [Luminiphilus syltensis]|uniref:polyphosphate kinase 2 family protein n=1 Tax=Luminiphilus syltensis TaxID=1341119 RepID=UPI0002DAFF1D|nr:polyphosphate kinase [Luminiphilus syltensis]